MANLDLSVDDIILRAQSKIGGGPFEGESLKDALIELNLVIQDIANNDIPLSFIKEITFVATAGQRVVDLDPEIVEVLSAVDVTNPSTSLPLNRQGLIEFQKRNSTDTSGQVSTFAVHSKKTGTDMLLWPIPATDTSIKIYAEVSPQEIVSYDEKLSIKSRFINTVIDGLAYHLARNQSTGTQEDELKLTRYERDYKSRLMASQHADREKSSFKIRFR